jgi:Ubiquitin fusion degradation protein UFD1
MYPIYPLSYLEQTSVNSGDEIIVPKKVFEQWLSTFPPGAPLLARLTNPTTEDSSIVCIGGQDTQNECIFAPDLVLEALHATEVQIEPFQEELPSATKLRLRLLDMEPIDGVDLRQALERHLDSYHVLSLGTMLRVSVEELDGTEVGFYVEDCEPAPVVRLGGEVILEILTNEKEEAVVNNSLPEAVVNNSLPEAVVHNSLPDAVVHNSLPDAVVNNSLPEPVVQNTVISNQEQIRLARLKAFAHLMTHSVP